MTKFIFLMISIVLTGFQSFAKDCVEEMAVEVVCATSLEDHPIDPIVEPEFLYFSESSYKKIIDKGLNPKEVSNFRKVCTSVDSYAIYELFGENALPKTELNFQTRKVSFLKQCPSQNPGTLKIFQYEDPNTGEYNYENPSIFELKWSSASSYTSWLNGNKIEGWHGDFYHYVFEWEDEFALDKMCYTGNLKEAQQVILNILNAGTGDSSQEVGELKMEGSTIVVPFSYIYEGGDSGMLEAVVKACDAGLSAWEMLSVDERADILYDLDYLNDEDLPAGLKIVDLTPDTEEFKLESILNMTHREFAEKALETFDNEVDREAIDQSPYSTYGDEEVMGFYLVTDESGKVLGASLRMYQDGRDQDGEDSDVNWQAFIRLDSTGSLFLNEEGHSIDDLYFEWSGH